MLFVGTQNPSYLIPNLKTHPWLGLPYVDSSFIFFFFNWDIVDLQYCVSFRCIAEKVPLSWSPLSPSWILLWLYFASVESIFGTILSTVICFPHMS